MYVLIHTPTHMRTHTHTHAPPVSQGKLQKHQAFEAEVVANKERIFSTISMGQGTCMYMYIYR